MFKLAPCNSQEKKWNKLFLALHNVYYSFRSTITQFYHTPYIIAASNLDNLSGFTSIFILILLDNIHAVSVEKLGTISKNNLRWITLEISPIWGLTLGGEIENDGDVRRTFRG